MEDFSLEDLIKACTDPSSPLFDRAWHTFIKKYKNYIYKVIYNRFKTWHQNHLPYDLSERVNDIANDVFLLLSRNNGRALAQFNATHSEKAFRGYLATISDRMARRALQKSNLFTSLDESRQLKDQSMSQESKWQIFDYLVATFRAKAGKQERHPERNILLFNLYTLDDYTKEMIAQAPVFHGMGHRVVDNVVGRLRDKLDEDDEINLRELLIE